MSELHVMHAVGTWLDAHLAALQWHWTHWQWKLSWIIVCACGICCRAMGWLRPAQPAALLSLMNGA